MKKDENIEEIKQRYEKFGLAFGHDLNLNLANHREKDGKLNYQSYVDAQTKANVEKIENKGPDEHRIKQISKYIKKNLPNYKFGICHGTRRGDEQKYFKKYLKIDVIGTEISHTAVKFPDTIQWDFHDIKDEWLAGVCFIFSNSLDHSYDPIFCLNQWMRCIRPGGKIFVQREKNELTEKRVQARQYPDADIFHSTEENFSKIVDAAGEGEWVIKKPGKLRFNVNKRIVVLERKE